MLGWKFTAKGLRDIDFDRICREAEEEGHDVIVVFVDGLDQAVILINYKFLSSVRDCGLSIVGRMVDEYWGSTFLNYAGIEYPPLHPDWSCCVFDVKDMPKIAEEIKAARAALRKMLKKRKVSVHYF